MRAHEAKRGIVRLRIPSNYEDDMMSWTFALENAVL